jgi:hypothetical protein
VAHAALAQQARENAAMHVAQTESEGRNHHTDLEATVPEPKAQNIFTDPDSKIMKTSDQGFDQCGNAQVITDENQVILTADVTNQAYDVRQAELLLAQLQSNVEAAELKGKLNEFPGAAGCFSDSNVNALVEAQLDPYMALQRLKHNEQIPEASAMPHTRRFVF